MREVVATATAGGLDVQGPIVLRPKHPGPPPAVASGIAEPGMSSTELYVRHQAQTAYAGVVNEYNAKVKVFNPM